MPRTTTTITMLLLGAACFMAAAANANTTDTDESEQGLHIPILSDLWAWYMSLSFMFQFIIGGMTFFAIAGLTGIDGGDPHRGEYASILVQNARNQQEFIKENVDIFGHNQTPADTNKEKAA